MLRFLGVGVARVPTNERRDMHVMKAVERSAYRSL